MQQLLFSLMIRFDKQTVGCREAAFVKELMQKVWSENLLSAQSCTNKQKGL